MVHACCGSSKILLYDCEQVIVDFDLDKKTFSFIDYKEMISALDIHTSNSVTTPYMVDLFILCVRNSQALKNLLGRLVQQKD